ncbi:hypothetical protein CLV63_111163 [Murinocardiopsis flavida]|uniref:Uncharacterized protein n=1 Tax=Murinocardiopsis flavida TaxID=645275 RepID=A0A2P8DH79_9ACTN|nr:hypothetical protein [Murinocardiopsis flavida]PSK96568.1 hypothetical protein CLV63_111163 [Murinocardiopsis flavida]
MAEFRISSDDDMDLRRLAAGLVESQGWPRDQVRIWDNRDGSVLVTIDDALLRRPEPDPMNLPVHTKSDVHRACEVLRQRDPSLRGVDFAVLRDEAARFFAAGWSSADLLHALGHRPDGIAWPRDPEYQGTMGLRHRLDCWKTPNGDIRPSSAQESAQLRIVGRAGLPENIGQPTDAPERRGQAARPEAARAAADDARRLMRAQSRTTSDTLAHRDRTAAHIHRTDT